MADVAVVEQEQPEASQTPSSTPLATEAIEASAEAATEVAEIEANRDVAIAEIQADVAREAIAASETTSAQQTELQSCQRNIEELRGNLSVLTQELSSIRELLTSREPSPPNLPEAGASAETPESPEAPEAPEPPKKKRRQLHWI